MAENTKEMTEIIICAAIKLDDGRIFYGHRHPHCIEAMNGVLSWTMNRQEIGKVGKTQGFVTNENRFVDRKEALRIAIESGQIKGSVTKIASNELYSEDLY